jgi:hypothetical protein
MDLSGSVLQFLAALKILIAGYATGAVYTFPYQLSTDRTLPSSRHFPVPVRRNG